MNHINTDTIFEITNEQDFNRLAVSVFRFQYQNNAVYKAFSDSLNINPELVQTIEQIPFLPISFFKTHQVVSAPVTSETKIFTSSSTTSQTPSKHYVADLSLYERSFLKGFEYFYGSPKAYAILALLPGYLEREGSSLVYMFNKLINLSEQNESGFFLNNYEALLKTIAQLKTKQTKTLLIGVTYALLDLCELNNELGQNIIVMETGGMKGRRKEMIKEELHETLCNKLGIAEVHSEYGMTELLSQAYSKGNGVFKCPPWMKVLIRDTEDPLSLVGENKTGGINVIDLANINSCSFIATQDLGRLTGNSFEVMGRFDNSDIRGCNLMIG